MKKEDIRIIKTRRKGRIQINFNIMMAEYLGIPIKVVFRRIKLND